MSIWIISRTALSSIVLRIHTYNSTLFKLLQTKCQMCNSTNNFCNKVKETSRLDKGIEKKIAPQDSDIAPSLESVIEENSDKLCSVGVIPGKGRPPEPPLDCCMSGCANCVWIQYAEELKSYYGDGTERALKEIDTIENESLKAFIKLELGLL